MKNSKSIAVFIDAENISYRAVASILTDIRSHGRLALVRAYGDWSVPSLKYWKTIIVENGIYAVHQFKFNTHKNSSDCALIIDAIDAINTLKFNTACIISGDADFTRLALRIRESNISVIGYGNRLAHKALRSACDKFIIIDEITN